MKLRRTLSLLIACVFSAGFSRGDDAESANRTVKSLAERFNQVEAQLDRSVRYASTETQGDATQIRRAWFNGAGELIKVTEEQASPRGRDLAEYFPRSYDVGDRGMFMFTRKERLLADGGTQVEEERTYYGYATYADSYATYPLRQLTKSGQFKPGETLDTVKIRNVPRKISAATEAEARKLSEAAEAIMPKPAEIADALVEKGRLEFDPFADIKGDSAQYRVIHGTASPDGRFAIALGFDKKVENWDEHWNSYAEGNTPETYFVEDAMLGGGEEGVINLVVDLHTRRILGRTGSFYMGTRSSYNHRGCRVRWSPDSSVFTEVFFDKWNFLNCTAGRIALGPKLVGAVNLGEVVEKNTAAWRRKHKQESDEGEGSFIDIEAVADDGTLEVDTGSSIRFGERKGDYELHLTQKLRLTEKGSKLRLETLAVRKAPDR